MCWAAATSRCLKTGGRADGSGRAAGAGCGTAGAHAARRVAGAAAGDGCSLIADGTRRRTDGWTDAAVFSLVVRVDPAKAQQWLPNSLLRVRGDTARVFFAWYARRRRESDRKSRFFSFAFRSRRTSSSRLASS